MMAYLEEEVTNEHGRGADKRKQTLDLSGRTD